MPWIKKLGLNALLVFIPAAFALERLAPDRPALIFLAAALGIIPLASLLVQATEQLALRSGDTLGGLLNATFGNAPELIIGFVALRSGYTDMVRASLIGAILANLLLGLGLAFLLGGVRHHVQEFNPAAARMQASMMLMAVISLMVPGGYHTLLTPETLSYERHLNTGVAVVLLTSYILGLVFMLRTHPDVFAPKKNHTEDGQLRWRVSRSVAVLVAASVGAAVMSETLVGAVEGASASLGMSKVFVGLMVLAIIGISELHFTSPGEQILAKMVATADVIGQIADRTYLEKLLFLFQELSEVRLLGYRTEFDLLENTLDSYRSARHRMENELDNVKMYLRSHFLHRWEIDGDLYEDAIESNISYLVHLLENHRNDYRDKLKRGGLLKRLAILEQDRHD